MPLRRAPAWLAASLLAACPLAACNVPFEREGIDNAYERPGPDPTGIPGIETSVAPLTEENVVEIARVAGRVLVRLPGERGSRNLEYWKPQIQTGPHGVVQTGPNALARLTFADESVVVIQHTALARVGDLTRGEPRLRFERLTRVEWTVSAEPRDGAIEIPGGAVVEAPARARVKVECLRDRDFHVWNDGRVPIEITHEGRKVLLRPAERVDVPVVRNPPAEVP